MQTAQQLYVSEVSGLAPSEQLRLATMILEGLTETAASALDYCEHWSEEDMREVTEFSAKHASRSLGEE